MTDALFDIQPTAPRWQQLADEHGIKTFRQIPGEPGNGKEWFAEKIDAGPSAYAYGDTEKEAVVALIHKLKLPGWQDVSIRP